MRDKKKTTTGKTPEQEALEKHVDAMMDPKQPDDPAENTSLATVEKPEPSITAVAAPADDAPKTAPQLYPSTGKKISVTHAADEPLSIDKLDELAKSITESDTPKKAKKQPKKTKKPDEENEETDTAKQDDEPEEITQDSTEFDDPETDKAVDDIVAYEGDVMLAVADSTAEERNRQAVQTEDKSHPVLSTMLWTLIALVVIVIIILGVLLVMGDSLADKLGL